LISNRPVGTGPTATAFAIEKNIEPRGVRSSEQRLAEFQDMLHRQGVETAWKDV
jgi:hypothetical protein